MTHLAFATPSFIISASLAWNKGTPEAFLKAQLPALLDAHVFGTCGFNLDGSRADGCEASPGKALLDLGLAESYLENKRSHALVNKTSADSILLRILLNTDEVALDGLAVDDFGIVLQKLKKAQSGLLKASSYTQSPREQSLNQELFLTSELLILSSRIGRSLMANGQNGSEKNVINVGVANLPPTFRTDIANKALTLVEQYRALWLSRYEPQGMQASLLNLSNMLSKFIPEEQK